MSDDLTSIWEDLQGRLGCEVTGPSPVRGGTQNRLFRVEVPNRPSLLVKVYHRDRWNRLDREFSVLSALGRAGVKRVPRAILENKELSYAVYSFEPGVTRSAAELTIREVEEVRLSWWTSRGSHPTLLAARSHRRSTLPFL